MPTSFEFHRRARVSLDKNIFSRAWIYALLVSAIASAVISLSGVLFAVPVVFVGPIMIGVKKYYLERSRRNIAPDRLSTALEGFYGDLPGNMIVGLLVTVYTFLWSLLLIVPGIIKSYEYAMTYYIKSDHPEYTADMAIRESRRMMYGYKLRLFYLHLSFIGWFILGALCFGIGTLWVSAYAEAATVEFYREISGQNKGSYYI